MSKDSENLKGYVQPHFNIFASQRLKLQDKLPDLGYSSLSEFLRETVRAALEEAPESKRTSRRGIRLTGRNDSKGAKSIQENIAHIGEQNVSGYPKSRMVQIHFNIPEKLWRLFLTKLPDLGYSTMSEFFRAKIREAISQARTLA